MLCFPHFVILQGAFGPLLISFEPRIWRGCMPLELTVGGADGGGGVEPSTSRWMLMTHARASGRRTK